MMVIEREITTNPFEDDQEGISAARWWVEYIGVKTDSTGTFDLTDDIQVLAFANRYCCKSLFETVVRCETQSDYHVAMSFYLRAGCRIWPWHKGFKPMDEDDSCPYYGWEPRGFLKHVVGGFSEDDENVITLEQLINTVNTHFKRVG